MRHAALGANLFLFCFGLFIRLTAEIIQKVCKNSKFGGVKQKKNVMENNKKEAIISKTVRKSKRGRESGQTREGIGAVAVRLRRHAFTDAPDTSVVLCFSGGREVRVVGTGDEGGGGRGQDMEEQSGGGGGEVECRGRGSNGGGGCPNSRRDASNRKRRRTKKKMFRTQMS